MQRPLLVKSAKNNPYHKNVHCLIGTITKFDSGTISATIVSQSAILGWIPFSKVAFFSSSSFCRMLGPLMVGVQSYLFNKMTIVKVNYTKQRETYIQGMLGLLMVGQYSSCETSQACSDGSGETSCKTLDTRRNTRHNVQQGKAVNSNKVLPVNSQQR